MINGSKASDILVRIRTGLPLALGITLLLFTPKVVVGVLVIVITFIGSQELTKMLCKSLSKGNKELLPEWLLPGTALLMGLGALNGHKALHAALLASALGWIFYKLIFISKSEINKLETIGFGLFGMVWAVWSILHIILNQFYRAVKCVHIDHSNGLIITFAIFPKAETTAHGYLNFCNNFLLPVGGKNKLLWINNFNPLCRGNIGSCNFTILFHFDGESYWVRFVTDN